jgi:hypothetical protein
MNTGNDIEVLVDSGSRKNFRIQRSKNSKYRGPTGKIFLEKKSLGHGALFLTVSHPPI